MSKAEKLLKSVRKNPSDVRFSDAVKLATAYFGAPRVKGSHHVFVTASTPVNLQDRGGKAKGYQVEQLLAAIDEAEAK